MTEGLQLTSKSIVENLSQTWLYRTIEEWSKKDTLEIRIELGLGSFSVTSTDPIEIYSNIKQHILSKTIHDDETLGFLMNIPKWVGFSLDKGKFQSGQQVIGAAKEEAIAMLWLMALPKIIISPTTLPEEYSINGISEFIEGLLVSDKSRVDLTGQISSEMEKRGIPDIVFEPNPIGRGYDIDESMREKRLKSLIALVIMKSSGCPFDLDQVFALDENKLIEETTAYIVSMHAKTTLRNQITGGGIRRLFDWPLIGNPKICSRLFITLDVLTQSATKMSTCSMFSSEIGGERKMWSDLDFINFLIQELSDHYKETMRVRHGKGQNRELALFIDLLSGEKGKIADRLLDSNDIGRGLFEELSDYTQRARIGEKPKITPEHRFKVVLSSLKQSLEDEKLTNISQETIIDQVEDAFDAILEVVKSHLDSLGDQAERFTQALCFETSYRLIQLLELGEALMDLPWVSRFIAEESARSDISLGDISKLDDEHRIQRIVSAFAGGVTYLIIQSHNNLM
ncbi:MAG: hypothetical protein ACW96M_04045 [Candidatus Thorarchaeota archaeon]|jgi:hypothetical protein